MRLFLISENITVTFNNTAWKEFLFFYGLYIEPNITYLALVTMGATLGETSHICLLVVLLA